MNTLRFILLFLSLLLAAGFWGYLLGPFILPRTVLFIVASLCLVAAFFWLFVRTTFRNVKSYSSEFRHEIISDEVGKQLPELGDKIKNYIQLSDYPEQNELIVASLYQKSKLLEPYDFTQLISMAEVKVQLKRVALLLGIFMIIGAFSPQVITKGTKQALYFYESFLPDAPFQFIFQNQDKSAFKNEDYVIDVLLDGDVIPAEAYVAFDQRLVKMNTAEKGRFHFTVPKIQKSQRYRIYAGGYYSDYQVVKINVRPELKSLSVLVDYPAYIGLNSDKKSNNGNLVVPEGSRIQWMMTTVATDSVEIVLGALNTEITSNTSKNEQFELKFDAKKSSEYEIRLFNEFGMNQHAIFYRIEVIEDASPEISVNYYADTILYDFVVFSGKATDDYGISRVNLHTNFNNQNKTIPLTTTGSKNDKSFYYLLKLKDLTIEDGASVQFYVSTWDNDAINGSKETKSSVFMLQLPRRDEINNSISKREKDTEDRFGKSLQDAKTLNEQIVDLQNRLKTKKEIDWQEEKLLQDILEQRNKLENEFEKLREEYEQLKESQDKFNNRSESLKQKADELRKLMNETLDEKTKQLYDELQKLMQQNAGADKVRDMLNKLSKSEKNTEKELERAIELFKRLQVESKLEKASDDLKNLSKEQEKLAQKVVEAKDSETLKEDQSKINEAFEDIKKQLDQTRELNQELKNPEPLENTTREENAIKQGLDDISNDLNNKSQKSTPQKMQKSANDMKKLGEKLAAMQASMEMEMMQENIEDLQKILDNVIRLSLKQEEIMNSLKPVQQSDPKFVSLSQEQLKLRDNAKVIEDSLLSLASRVASISTFVTREVGEVNRHLDNAIEELKERNKSKAMGHQQFSMTSINNLGLLLSDVLKQMQMAMNESMGNPKSGKGKQQNLPNIKQLQEQLSQQIQQLKDGGKTGRELSEELARMAAEQEMLRNQLQEMKENMDGRPGNESGKQSLSKALEQMEQNETDLVNKRITKELIDRQAQIITRLLEAEQSMREQDEDEEREGQQAENYEKRIPKAFDEYLKAKEKELELIKSVPLQLNPFYKKEVNDYFRRISNQ